MSQDQWTKVDRYITDLFVPPDEALDGALKDSEAAGLPAIAVSLAQGKMLHVLVLAMGARNILELGTLGGYSTIWLARALPKDGKLITLEFEPKHAEVAKKNIARAKLSKKVEILLGPALATLPKLVAEKRGPFDLIFIDADKETYPEYFQWALKLSRRGTLIIADNIVRNGAITDPADPDIRVQGARRFNKLVAAEPRVTATVIQTVGCKGYDGFGLIVVQ